jgi:dihydrolipoamide dehydrogenase
MGMALLSDHGFVKILIERRTRNILGVHIIGEEASNMVHMVIALMYKNGTLDDLLNMIYIHPALPEIVRNAARKARTALDALA